MYAAAAHSNISFSSPRSVLLMQTELDSLHDSTISQLNNSEFTYNNSCSSSYVGSPSPTSTATTTTPPNNPILMMQRSLSSHSLILNNNNGRGTHHPFSALFAELLDSEDPPVRRVYSTGDLQRFNGMQHNSNNDMDSPLSNESSMIIEGMSRVCPYSPQEKKIRIERYKIKRNQRNFNKKIKYACRKTLADRRPRIRGRFARNDEIEKNTTVEWSHIGSTEEDENWVSIFNSIAAANLADHDSQTSSTFGLLCYLE